MDGFSDRGSTPLRSIRKVPQSFALGHFSYKSEKIELITRKRLGFWTGAHEVRWTSVLRRPERSVDRLPSGP